MSATVPRIAPRRNPIGNGHRVPPDHRGHGLSHPPMVPIAQGPGSLPKHGESVHTPAMTHTERRRFVPAASALVGFVLVAAACSSSAKTSTPATTTTRSTVVAASTSSSVTASTAATSTTIPLRDVSTAVWPTVTGPDRYRAASDAARTFAVSYLHFVKPVVGTFRAGDARSGEVPIRPRATGPVTTVLVRQLVSDGTWWVLGATTPNIVVRRPATLATIASPVELSGSSTAFEATVQYAVREDDQTKPLAEGFVMGGANGRMGPFKAKVALSRPTRAYGAVTLYTISPADGNVLEASVI